MDLISYNQAVSDYADSLLRYILKNINRDMETAKDIVQNCYEALWKNREQVAVEKCKSFLFTVAHHQIIDRYRKSGRMLYVEDYHENDLRQYQHGQLEQKEILHLALMKLGALQRSMVLLKDYEGYSYVEIALMVGVTEGQVKINLFRARKKLQEIIGSSPKVKVL